MALRNDIDKTIEKIVKYESIYGKNSADCFLEYGEAEKYPKDWKDNFELYYNSKCDMRKINTIKPLKTITILGENTMQIREQLEGLNERSIIQVSEDNTCLKFYENLTNLMGHFLYVYSRSKIKRKMLPNEFNIVGSMPKMNMLKNTEKIIFLTEYDNYDFLKKCDIKEIEFAFQK